MYYVSPDIFGYFAGGIDASESVYNKSSSMVVLNSRDRPKKYMASERNALIYTMV